MKRRLLQAVLLGLAVVALSSPAASAQNCNRAPNTGYSAAGARTYAQWCSACGGTPTGNFKCDPGSHWGRRESGSDQPSDNSAAIAAAAAAAEAERRQQEEELRKE